jgi:hypothetical protein
MSASPHSATNQRTDARIDSTHANIDHASVRARCCRHRATAAAPTVTAGTQLPHVVRAQRLHRALPSVSQDPDANRRAATTTTTTTACTAVAAAPTACSGHWAGERWRRLHFARHSTTEAAHAAEATFAAHATVAATTTARGDEIGRAHV